jgi:hypothetical protein
LLALLALAELALRLLPAPKGLHRENPQAQISSARLVRSQPYVFSMGWDLRHVVRGRTNAMGFLSPHEFDAGAGPAVALIGDSFAEGEMLAYEESLAGRLEARSAGAIRAFNFGLSGAALPHYLGIAREMGGLFRFDAAVIVVVPGDYAEGFLQEEGMYGWAERGPDVVSLVAAARRSKWKEIVRESALLHYVRGNLKFSPSTLFARSKQEACVPQRLAAADRGRLARYVDALPQALRLEPGRIVLAFNINTKEIYERIDRRRAGPPGERCPDIDTLALAELRTLAASRGMRVIEIGPLLERHYRANRRPLDFRPVDPHWNGLATEVIAGEVARELSLAGDPLRARQAMSRTD